MRSKLFVPASRPELFAKALAGAADALSFDLEDAVAAERKSQAREALCVWLASDAARSTRKTLIVRVNAPDTAWFGADVEAVVQPGLAYLNLPKAESTDGVRAAVAAIERAERRNGVTQPVRLLLNIETPRALREAARLAGAHERVAGVQLGLGDLFEPLGVARREPAAVQQAMFALRLAAGEAGVFAYDTAFGNIQDIAGFRAEAQLARSLGYLGKSCIHPSQVATANEVFQPTGDELAQALRIVQAAHTAERAGVGAYVVDGRMIDRPFVDRARALVREGQRLGLVAGDAVAAATADAEVSP